jgi:hypothetical protein
MGEEKTVTKEKKEKVWEKETTQKAKRAKVSHQNPSI